MGTGTRIKVSAAATIKKYFSCVPDPVPSHCAPPPNSSRVEDMTPGQGGTGGGGGAEEKEAGGALTSPSAETHPCGLVGGRRPQTAEFGVGGGRLECGCGQQVPTATCHSKFCLCFLREGNPSPLSWWVPRTPNSSQPPTQPVSLRSEFSEWGAPCGLTLGQSLPSLPRTAPSAALLARTLA